MTLDGFLTFLALMVAFYAVVPPIVRLRFKLHVWPQIVLAAIGLVSVLYLEFFPIVGQPCFLPSEQICSLIIFREESSFTPQQAAFLVVITWMATAYFVNRYIKAGPNALGLIRKQVEQMMSKREFYDVMSFIQPYFKLIEATAFPNESSTKLKFRWQGLGASSMAQMNAEEIALTLYKSHDFRSFTFDMRPSFALDLISMKFHHRFEYSDAFLQHLLRDSKSELFWEVKNNQNYSDRSGYYLNESNKILSFYLRKASTATELQIWKPVGDEILRQIKPLSDNSYIAFLNGPADSFDEEQWRDPSFFGIRFFDIMLNAGVRENADGHMWPHYIRYFLQEIIKNTNMNSKMIDLQAEYPTRGAKLIYEGQYALRNSIRSIIHLPSDSRHSIIPNDLHTPSASIPYWAAVNMGNVMRDVVLSDGISDGFKLYIHECVLRDIKSLPTEGNGGRLRSLLIKAIVHGGQLESPKEYSETMQSLLTATDHVLRSDVSDYVNQFEETHSNA